MKLFLFIALSCLRITCFVKAQDGIEKTSFFAGVSVQPPLAAGTVTSVGFLFAGELHFKNSTAITASIWFTPHIGFKTKFIIPYNSEFSILPLLIGYRKYTGRFYIEPQIGGGLFSKTVTYDVQPHEKVFNDGALYYGGESGYKISGRFHVFIQYHRLNSFTSTYFDRKFDYGGFGAAARLD